MAKNASEPAWEDVMDAEHIKFRRATTRNKRRAATCEELEKHQLGPKVVGWGSTLFDLRQELIVLTERGKISLNQV
jgi:hypothetical protein